MQDLLSSKKFQIGFTLIELLIAVTIIVILVIIGAVSYTTVNRNARDGQRKSDLKKMQIALENYYADYGSYPDEKYNSYSPLFDPSKQDQADIEYCTNDGTNVGPLFFGSPFTCDGRTYLSTIPVDPSNSRHGYYYEVSQQVSDNWCTDVIGRGHCQQYTLWASLENTSDANWKLGDPNNDPICNIAQADDTGNIPGSHSYKYNYCVHGPLR